MSSPSRRCRYSVIVAIFNVEQWLPRCLDSLTRCRETDIEFILVNDGSTDGSLRMCRQAERNDHRFSVIDQKNRGLSGARNSGMEMAQGEYLLFVDGDDYLMPEAFERFLAFVSGLSSRPDMIWNDYYRVWAGRCACIRQIQRLRRHNLEAMLRAHGGIWNVWRCAYRREFLRQQGLIFRESFLCEDLDFTTRAVAQATVVLTHHPYYCYIDDRADSIMNRADSKRIHDQLTIISDLLEYLETCHPERKRLLVLRLFREFVLTSHQLILPGDSKEQIWKQAESILQKFSKEDVLNVRNWLLQVAGIERTAHAIYYIRKAKRLLR